MRQNALERPRKCSDIVPRTFLAHFCHFLELQILGNFENFCKNAILRPSHSQHMLCKNGDLTTSETASKSLSDVCPIAIFAQHMFSDERPQNRIFGPLRGYTGKIKNLKSAIFPHDFGLKFSKIFENFWKKNAIFSTDSRRSKISKMVSRKAKTRFLSALLSTNRDNRARSIPYDHYWTSKCRIPKITFSRSKKMLECKTIFGPRSKIKCAIDKRFEHRLGNPLFTLNDEKIAQKA